MSTSESDSNPEYSDGSVYPSTSTPRKRKRLSYGQKYKNEWEKELTWLRDSKKGPMFGW